MPRAYGGLTIPVLPMCGYKLNHDYEHQAIFKLGQLVISCVALLECNPSASLSRKV